MRKTGTIMIKTTTNIIMLNIRTGKKGSESGTRTGIAASEWIIATIT